MAQPTAAQIADVDSIIERAVAHDLALPPRPNFVSNPFPGATSSAEQSLIRLVMAVEQIAVIQLANLKMTRFNIP